MRKICVVTGTRAEYGLLYWLMQEINRDPDLELQLIVTGMHLSPEFGLTYKEVEKDFKIDKKVEILLSSDTPAGISKSMGLAQISLAETYLQLNPDILVLLGDRFEIFSAASAAAVCGIPVAHLHGGETTEGAFDEYFRHAITKMSHLHFTATEAYRKRVIQLGEHPDRVFNSGGLGVDAILQAKLMSKSELEKAIDFKFGKRNLLVTFHPVTLERSTASRQFSELLRALDELDDTKIIFTKANADTDGRVINQMIEEYSAKNSERAIQFASMGFLRYISAMQFVDAVVGNSSSGLLEAPSLKVPTVNIGDRQKNRVKAESVLDCLPEEESIKQCIRKIYTKEFQDKVKDSVNPYGNGGASRKIKEILKTVSLENILKKSFYNLDEPYAGNR